MMHQENSNPSLEEIASELEKLDFVLFMSTKNTHSEELVWHMYTTFRDLKRRRLFNAQYLTKIARQQLARGAQAIAKEDSTEIRCERTTKVYLDEFSRKQIITLLEHVMKVSYNEIHMQAVNQHLKNSGFFDD